MSFRDDKLYICNPDETCEQVIFLILKRRNIKNWRESSAYLSRSTPRGQDRGHVYTKLATKPGLPSVLYPCMKSEIIIERSYCLISQRKAG